jgi:hypothetical protein
MRNSGLFIFTSLIFHLTFDPVASMDNETMLAAIDKMMETRLSPMVADLATMKDAQADISLSVAAQKTSLSDLDSRVAVGMATVESSLATLQTRFYALEVRQTETDDKLTVATLDLQRVADTVDIIQCFEVEEPMAVDGAAPDDDVWPRLGNTPDPPPPKTKVRVLSRNSSDTQNAGSGKRQILYSTGSGNSGASPSTPAAAPATSSSTRSASARPSAPSTSSAAKLLGSSLSSSSLPRGPPPNSNANNSNPPETPKPDPRPKEVRFGNFPQRLYRTERQDWLTSFFKSVDYDALEGVKATFGKESGEAFIICKFPSFDDAVKFVNKFKGNPALDFEGTQIYISVNYFGRKKSRIFFSKKP